jgi:shikimate dehydrogenase
VNAARTLRPRPFAILGDPVEHSLSPRIQNAAFRATGVDGEYRALRCSPGEVTGHIERLTSEGGGGNVTLPHKATALAAAEVVLPAAERTEAANTFWEEGGRIHVDNTDVVGFRGALETLIPAGPMGARVLLLGAGGAARAVVAVLLDGGVAEVMVLNRTPARAWALAERFGDRRLRVAADRDAVRGHAPDLVVNATRLGLDGGDPRPLDLERLDGAGALMDLVYGPEGTPLVAEARALGIPAADGSEMLLRQGAAAFERWWGREAPIAVMRAALAGEDVG